MPQNGIQDELAELSRLFEVLMESHRQFVCDRRLPENTRLMEIRATNRDLQSISKKIKSVNANLIKFYNLEPFESSEEKK